MTRSVIRGVLMAVILACAVNAQGPDPHKGHPKWPEPPVRVVWL